MKKYNFHKYEGVESICDVKTGSPIKIAYVCTDKLLQSDVLHYHDQGHEYYILLKGKIILQINQNFVEAIKGDVIHVEPCEEHKVYSVNEEVEYIVIRTNHHLGDRIVLEG